MTTFAVIDKATGKEVYRYDSETRVEWHGFGFATHDHVAKPSAPTENIPAAGPRRLTKQEFFDRLGVSAVAFILYAAKTSVEIEMWVKRLDLTTPDPDGTSVDLDDPRTIHGVESIGTVLAANGVVGEDWSAGVLA